jgi:hypothetical protein
MPISPPPRRASGPPSPLDRKVLRFCLLVVVGTLIICVIGLALVWGDMVATVAFSGMILLLLALTGLLRQDLHRGR